MNKIKKLSIIVISLFFMILGIALFLDPFCLIVSSRFPQVKNIIEPMGGGASIIGVIIFGLGFTILYISGNFVADLRPMNMPSDLANENKQSNENIQEA